MESHQCTSPTFYDYGAFFGYGHWIDGVAYTRTRRYLNAKGQVITKQEYERGTADLSAKKVVWVKENPNGSVEISLVQKEGFKEETWAPVYRKKGDGDAAVISLTCAMFYAPLTVPFALVYNTIRLVIGVVALPFYHIAMAIKEGCWRKDEDKRSGLEIVWDHVVSWIDDTISLGLAIPDNLCWRLLACVAHVISFVEGLVIFNPRTGRKLDSFAESKANREVSVLWWLHTKEWQKADLERPNRYGGASLYSGYWSVGGAMSSRVSFLSTYHVFFLAGCFMPMAVGVVKDNQITHLRNDLGRLIGPAIAATSQQPYSPCCF